MDYEKTISIHVSGFKMIREIQLKDKEQWEKLYKGYADFYKTINTNSSNRAPLKWRLMRNQPRSE